MRGRWLILIGAVLLGCLLTLYVVSGERVAASSVLSRSGAGWHGVARWLADRGSDIVVLDRPLTVVLAEEVPPVIVVSFPATSWYERAELEGLHKAVREGACLVVGVSGHLPSPPERQLADSFGFGFEADFDEAPLVPWRWHRWAGEIQQLQPLAPWSGGEISVSRSSWRALPDDDEEVLYVWPDGAPAVWMSERGEGRVVVLPALCFANAFVAHPGNYELLASLAQAFPHPWAFDEYRHGLVDPTLDQVTAGLGFFDGLMLHLVLLYAVAVLAAARRFGPAWKVVTQATGSTAQLLLSVARIHRRLGHHPAAARLLVKRSVELDTKLRAPELTHLPADDTQLLALERELRRSKEKR